MSLNLFSLIAPALMVLAEVGLMGANAKCKLWSYMDCFIFFDLDPGALDCALTFLYIVRYKIKNKRPY